MDVAFFSESYVPTLDGVAHVVHGLARQMTRWGHRVRVYTPNPVHGAPTERVEIEGVPVIRVRAIPVPLYHQYSWGLFPFKQLRGENFARDVDVIHLHTPGMMGTTAFLAARHFGKPLLGTFHTNVWAMRESFPSTAILNLFFRVARWYTLGTYLRCDLTTAPTEAARNELLYASRKPFRVPVEVVPNGIELDRFRPGLRVPDWRVRCGLPDGPLATYLGRLTVDKGVHRFLDAVSEVAPEHRFSAIVAGAGPEEANVRERIGKDERLAGRVRYVGPVAEEEKAALLSQTNVFVVPSTSDTASISLLEAMACGVPCLASDLGGLRDVVEDGRTGRLVSVTQSGALARALGELLADPAERARLAGEALRQVRANASIDVTARRFISLYELLLSRRSLHATDTAE
ncbi:MAG: glycosyltransferase [Thermoplasmata archaeon]